MRYQRFRFIIFFCVLIFSPALAKAEPAHIYTARVIGIIDGDTIDVLTPEKQKIRVRIKEIDAPERSQPFGSEAKQMLSYLLFKKDVIVVATGQDKNGRVLGRIFPLEADISMQMIQRGGAWAYRAYGPEKAFISAENKAKRNKEGLWALPEKDRIAPWDWRHNKKN